jgi:hypothetical protein
MMKLSSTFRVFSLYGAPSGYINAEFLSTFGMIWHFRRDKIHKSDITMAIHQ